MVLADWLKTRGYYGGSYSLYSDSYISPPYSLQIIGNNGYGFLCNRPETKYILNGIIELWIKCGRNWGFLGLFPTIVFRVYPPQWAIGNLRDGVGDAGCTITINLSSKVIYYGRTSAEYWNHGVYSNILNSVNLTSWHKWRVIFYTDEQERLVIKVQVMVGGEWQNVCDPFIDDTNPHTNGVYCGFGAETGTYGVLFDDIKIYKLTPL